VFSEINAMLTTRVLQPSNQIISLAPDPDLLDRVKKLEDLHGALQEEVNNLKRENAFLTKTVSKLNEENKQLRCLNSSITQEHTDLQGKYEALLKEHEKLTKENTLLKKQVQGLNFSAPPRQEAKQGIAAPKLSLSPNYNFLNSPQTSQKGGEPRLTIPGKSTTKFDTYGSLYDKKPAVKVF
jgi:FtsZ-binding cell division protein ZapB